MPEGSAEERPSVVVPQPRKADGVAFAEGLLAECAGLDPGEIFERVADGDPLELHRRGVELLRREGLLIDAGRVFEEAVTEVAGELALGPALSGPEAWLEERVRRALARVRRRDAEWVRSGGERADESGPGEFLVRVLGVRPELAPEAALGFAEFSKRTRRRFFALVIDGWSLAKTAEWFGGDAREISEDVWQVLRLFQLAGEDDQERIFDELIQLDTQREALS